MLWKETRDSTVQGRWSALICPFLLIGILGIFVPLRLAQQWLALTSWSGGLSSLSRLSLFQFRGRRHRRRAGAPHARNAAGLPYQRSCWVGHHDHRLCLEHGAAESAAMK